MEFTQIKRGGTFALAGPVPLPAGVWSAASDIKKSDGSLIAALTCVLTPISPPDADGNTYLLTIGADASITAAWPLGKWVADIRFADGSGVVLYTNTFGVDVVQEITD